MAGDAPVLRVDVRADVVPRPRAVNGLRLELMNAAEAILKQRHVGHRAHRLVDGDELRGYGGGHTAQLSTLALSASSRPPSLGREGSPARRLRSMSDHAMTGGINAG